MSLTGQIALVLANGCGAGSPGGKGFGKGNTCGSGSKSGPQLSKGKRAELSADLERVFETSEFVDKEYADGLKVEMAWQAGNYSSKGAWMDGRVLYKDENAQDWKARTPKGAMTAINNAFKRLTKYRE